MKLFVTIDVVIQTLVLGAFTPLILYQMFANDWLRTSIMLFFAIGLGTWQMISAAITAIARQPFKKLRRWYLGISVLYLLTLNFMIGASIFARSQVLQLLSGMSIVTIPAFLAFFYYRITIKTYWLAKANAKSNNATT